MLVESQLDKSDGEAQRWGLRLTRGGGQAALAKSRAIRLALTWKSKASGKRTRQLGKPINLRASRKINSMPRH